MAALEVLAHALALIFLSLVPVAAPLDAREPAGALNAIAFVLVLLCSAALARSLARKWPLAAALVIAAALGATIAAVIYAGDRGPVARAALWMSPLAWAAIGALVAGPVIDRARRGRATTRGARALVIALAVAASIAML